MKIEFGGLRQNFWVRNLLRAALVFLWYDQGRFIGRFGSQPVAGNGFLIIVSIVIVIILEGVKDPGDNKDE